MIEFDNQWRKNFLLNYIFQQSRIVRWLRHSTIFNTSQTKKCLSMTYIKFVRCNLWRMAMNSATYFNEKKNVSIKRKCVFRFFFFCVVSRFFIDDLQLMPKLTNQEKRLNDEFPCEVSFVFSKWSFSFLSFFFLVSERKRSNRCWKVNLNQQIPTPMVNEIEIKLTCLVFFSFFTIHLISSNAFFIFFNVCLYTCVWFKLSKKVFRFFNVQVFLFLNQRWLVDVDFSFLSSQAVGKARSSSTNICNVSKRLG